MNQKKRLIFAKEFISKEQIWNDVIFADESKFNIFGSDRRKMIQRKANEEFKLKNLKPTMTHGGRSSMVWGCISNKGVSELVFIDGILDKNKYLKDNLIKSANNMNI